MPVEIKELIVRGIVDNGSSQSDIEIIKILRQEIENYNFGISPSEKKEIIKDCLAEMKSILDRKSNF
jgi:hypothetical protein